MAALCTGVAVLASHLGYLELGLSNRNKLCSSATLAAVVTVSAQAAGGEAYSKIPGLLIVQTLDKNACYKCRGKGQADAGAQNNHLCLRCSNSSVAQGVEGVHGGLMEGWGTLGKIQHHVHFAAACTACHSRIEQQSMARQSSLWITCMCMCHSKVLSQQGFWLPQKATKP